MPAFKKKYLKTVQQSVYNSGSSPFWSRDPFENIT